MDSPIEMLIFVGILIFSSLIFLILFIVDYLPKRSCVKIHSQGYEVLDNVSTTNLLGEPIYFTVVRYKDGCIEKIQIPAKEYFEKIGTIRSDNL